MKVEIKDDFCRTCGKCCRELYIEDKIQLSFVLGKIIIKNVCPYSTKQGCSIHDKRPNLCRKWTCGGLEIIQHSKKGKS